MTIDVATPVYEGPFDLLLHLILREEVDIYEVDLARIVDAYLVEIERMQSLDLDVATEFLLIAATLVELKARRLLPGRDDVDLDDELALWEERDLLLARLLECKTFKDVAARVRPARRRRPTAAVPAPGRRPTSASPSCCPTCWPASRPRASATPPIARPRRHEPVPRDRPLPRRPDPDQRRRRGGRAVDELPRVGRISFRRLTGVLVERLEVIVRFLAVLELFKQGVVELDQTERFGDIEIAWIGPDDGPPSGPGRRRRLRGMMDDLDDPIATPDGTRARLADWRLRPLADRPACGPSRRSCWSPTTRSPPELLAQLLEQPVAAIERWCHELAAGYEAEASAGSSWSGSPAATATRPTPTWRPTSSASCSTTSGPGCRARRSRRWPSSPTSSRSRGPRSPRSAASTPTACCARCRRAGYIDEVGRDTGPGQAVLFGTTEHVPREARPRLGRRPAADRRVHPRRRRRRGARAGLRVDAGPPDT